MKQDLAAFNDLMRLCALAGSKFNSYYETTCEIKNIITNEQKEFKIVNQFVSTDKRNTAQEIEIGFWRLSYSSLLKKEKVKSAQIFDLEKKYCTEDEVEIFFPLVLSEEYPGFIESLGKPLRVYKSLLGSSGRTFWVFCEDRPSFCLKIDTMQLDDRKFFLERILYESSIEHTLKIAKLLEKQDNVFSEHSGVSIEFDYLYQNTESKKYRFLIRDLDAERCELDAQDVLLPMTAIGSVSFWKSTTLINSLAFSKKPSSFYIEDVARCIAELIKKSLDETFIHFEIHMQNMNLLIRKGEGIKFIYNDLQDSLFDPVSYLLTSYFKIKTKTERELNLFFKEIFETTFQIQKTMTINSQGQLLVRTDVWHESATVVSFYRRYLRNLGDYGRIYNLLAGKDFLYDKEFEEAVLKYLEIQQADLNLNEDIENLEFLKKDLFWTVNRYWETKQNRMLKMFADSFGSQRKQYPVVAPDYVKEMLSGHVAIRSNNFPVHRDDIEYKKFGPIYDLYDKSLLFFEYDNKPVLLFIIIR